MKERLIGAVVLVLAAVVFIPMVLDGPGSGRQVTQQVPLPDVEAQSELRTVRIDLDAPDSPAAVAAEEGAASRSEPAAVDLTPSQDAEGVAQQQPAVALTTPTRQPVATPSERPVEPPSQAADEAAWTVQAGSFSRSDNAETLAARLRGMGFPAYVSRFTDDDRVHYRVRIGGFATRDAADRKAAEIRTKTGEPARSVPAR